VQSSSHTSIRLYLQNHAISLLQQLPHSVCIVGGSHWWWNWVPSPRRQKRKIISIELDTRADLPAQFSNANPSLAFVHVTCQETRVLFDARRRSPGLTHVDAPHYRHFVFAGSAVGRQRVEPQFGASKCERRYLRCVCVVLFTIFLCELLLWLIFSVVV
jgi:hypothetical protein